MQSFLKSTFYAPLCNLTTTPYPSTGLSIKSLVPLLFLGDALYHLITLFFLPRIHLCYGLVHLIIALAILCSLQLTLSQQKFTSITTKNILIFMNFLHAAVDIWFFEALDFEALLSSQQLSSLVKLTLEQLWRFFMLDILSANTITKLFYLMMCLRLTSVLNACLWIDFLVRGKFFFTMVLTVTPLALNSLRSKNEAPLLFQEDSSSSIGSRGSFFRSGSMATVASLVNKIASTDALESPNVSLSRTKSVNYQTSNRKKLAAQPIVESAGDILEESTYDTITQRSTRKISSVNCLPESLATILENSHNSQISPALLEDLHIAGPVNSMPDLMPISNFTHEKESSPAADIIPVKAMPFLLENGATTRSLSNEELDWEHRIQAKILNELPEGVVVIDYQGRIRFLNSYMRNTFQCDEKVSFAHLSSKLCEFKFVETSIHINENDIKGISRCTAEDTLTMGQYNDETSSDSRDEFLAKIQKVSSLEQLFSFYVKELESWEANQNCVPTFQTKFYHQLVTDWVPMEVKANLASEAGDQKCLIILLRDTTGRDNKIFTLETEKIVYRNNLIASFSHELRTPLNANMAFLEQAIDSNEISSTVKQELIKPALISGKLLYYLISDILDYSQLIVNCLQLKIKPFSLAQTINTCLELFQEKMNQKNLVVKVNIDKDIPKFFYTDHARLKQILINLVSNAIKFTMDGCISVTLKRTPSGSVIVSVEDDGVGMEPDAQENLRLRLSEERLKDRVNGDSVGVGLGLFISNKLAQLLSPTKKQANEKEGIYDDEGRAGIAFWSERNQGSHFYIEIENRIPTVKKQEIQKKKNHYSMDEEGRLNDALNEYSTRPFKNTFRLKKGMEEEPECTILIVDDEVFNIMVIENFCKSLKIPTEKAFNGREAVAKMQSMSKDTKHPIKIVFMDVNMPVMDGYTASMAIQRYLKEEQIEDVVIIGVTAYVSRDMIDKCFKCGMAEVLNKPLSKGMVTDVLKRYGVV